jgi:hypothetical protein
MDDYTDFIDLLISLNKKSRSVGRLRVFINSKALLLRYLHAPVASAANFVTIGKAAHVEGKG